MLFTREAQATSLSDRMHLVAAMLKTRSRNNFTDSNHTLEFVMLRFLNALFGWELKDLNAEQQNFPAADLGDSNKGIAFQITNEETSDKIRRTTDTAQEHHLGKSYRTLIIFFLLPRKPGFPRNFVQPPEGPEIETWDLTELLKKMLAIQDLTQLSAASTLLDEEGIPDPWHSAPQFTRVPALPPVPPKAADELFGRESDLPEVLRRFTENPRLALTGDGGLGKTALSAALLGAWRESGAAGPPEARNFFVHDFYKAATLIDFHSSILAQAGLRAIDSRDDAALAAHILHQPGVLLYIEGAERLDDLQPLLDLIGPDAALLLTTRHPGQAEDLPSYRVEPLPEAPAIALLHHHAHATALKLSKTPWSHDVGDPAWSPLARDLGGHALACQLAGKFCGKHHKSPAAFHQQLKGDGLAPLSKGNSSKNNLDILWRSAALALVAELPGEPSPAITAWHCLTLGGTNPTPFSVLQALGAGDEHALTVLIDHGLAESNEVAAATNGETEPGYNLTHALLSEWAKLHLPTFHPSLPDLLAPAMAWGRKLHDEVVRRACVPGGPERYTLLIPLATALLATVGDDSTLTPVALYTCYYLPARMHSMHGQYSAAEPFYRKALATMEDRVGPEDHSVATGLDYLAQLLVATNRLDEAEPLLRRTLAIDEGRFGPDHPNVATSLNNLAQLLVGTQRLDEAEPLLRRALAIHVGNFGPDHPNVGTSLNNLAILLRATRRVDEVETLFRRALAIDEANFGPDHPRTATTLINLAHSLQGTSRLDEAELLIRRALAIDEANFGLHHPRVASNLNSLAHLLQATQRLDEIEPLVRRALAIDEASFEPSHPNVARSLNNLANVLLDGSRLEEAEPPMRRAAMIVLRFTAGTGHKHPHLKDALQNYARLCSAMGCKAEEIWPKLFEVGEEVGMLRERMYELLKEVFP